MGNHKWTESNTRTSKVQVEWIMGRARGYIVHTARVLSPSDLSLREERMSVRFRRP